MTASALVALIGFGLGIGVFSGLLGLGGGVLIVPFLYFFYAHPSWTGVRVPEELQAVVAHATSLFIILPTAVRGTWSYHRVGRIAWAAALPIGVTAVGAAVLGAALATWLTPEALKLAFGLVLIASGVQLLRPPRGAAGDRPQRLSLWVTVPVGLAVGGFSALIGVGGGIVAIPLLIYLVGLQLEEVAGTSIAIIVLAAVAGVATYVVRGWGVAALPRYSVGYVHVLVGLPILAASVLAVRWGVELNRRMDTRALRALFALLFLALGARLTLLNAGAVL